ncbi:NAD-dependent epimerase/dehydratase family protein [Kribbella albertanoniae]|uniref:NAD-dependent epimerase n=1 Tax=Kribbella albertanoniae TaxID=1266829 RepID=A0A4R4Q4Z4_9ACTN|nr:NAD-dependent epimerase/dehydratase family protein [Kribbella albertanoniae]TDC30019.1 NAD-dependent epimerase [Kribbella albertanoniae]
MALQVVVGQGPVGTAVARLLVQRGDHVKLISRRGGAPDGIEGVAADATNGDELARIAEGAATIYSCAGPPYPQWATDWPPLGAGLVRAAELSKALLVTTGNLYGYGEVDGPIREDLPLKPNSVKGQVRTQVWTDALKAHEAGRIRTAEVRGSDYLGAGAMSPYSVLVLPKLLAGKAASIPADLDAPHSWTYVGDVARTLIAVADDDTKWGRAWHVPSPEPLSVRALATLTAELAGTAPARISSMPSFVLRLGGLFNSTARASIETQYQWRRPFTVDSTPAMVAFGIEPVPVADAVREMIELNRSTGRQ